MNRLAFGAILLATVAAGVWAATRPLDGEGPPSGVVTRWRTWTKADGLPDDRVFAVLKAPEGLYAGTERGLALLDGEKVVRTWGEADGMSFPVVTSMCRDERSGDVWVGTLRGLTRVSHGTATAVRQSPDGLVNDVVYSVCTEGRHLWCATAAGLSRLDLDAGTWTTWTEKNSPMKEIWCYSVCQRDGKVWVAIWGSGVLEHDVATGHWKLYQDPDRDMRFDLFKHDGLVSDVVVGVSADRGNLWCASYLGLSRYDGRDWRTWTGEDSPLASSFISTLRSRGPEAWMCTDRGLSQFDGTRWATYRRAASGGTVVVADDDGGPRTEHRTATALPDDFVWSVDFDGLDVWVGTSGGLARGTRNGPAPDAPVGGTRP